MSVTVRLGPYTFDHVSYDTDGDVLCLSIGHPPDAARSEETPEGHIVRYDAQDRIVGVAVVNAKRLLERGERLAITLPAASASQTAASTMAELPDEWTLGDDGQPALDWVAAVRRSRGSR